MKLILSLFIIGVPFCVKAQYKTLVIPPVELKPKAKNQIPDWIDTTHKIATKVGYVVRLKQDNMPCILPYGAPKIPNSFDETQPPSYMPNLWDNINKNNKSGTNNLLLSEGCKKDSLSLKMIPKQKK